MPQWRRRSVAFFQVFRGHPVEGAAFVDRVPESQRERKVGHPQPLHFASGVLSFAPSMNIS